MHYPCVSQLIKIPSVACRCLGLALCFSSLLVAQEASPQGEPALASKQRSVAKRFKRLEELLLRSSDLEASENPARSALLQQAVQLSKQVQLTDALLDAANSLDSQQFSDAIETQKAAKQNLSKILLLLQSENRSQRVREQRNQVKRWIEEADRLLRMQGALRGRTEGGQDLERSAENQKQLEAKARQIADDLLGDAPSKDGESKQGESKQGESKQGESKQGESKQGESKQGDSKQGESKHGESKQGESKPGESKPGESKPGESKQGESKQGESKQGESKQGESKQGESKQGESKQGESKQGESKPKPQTPSQRAGEKLRKAQQKMREAQEDLKKSRRQDAVEKQREAEDELREAVAELEQILRQLREEEIERSLATLETRLRRMLEMQNKVLTETTRLSEIGGENQNRQIEIMASKLSLEEKKILAEGLRAVLLLREEGSSAAFPEAMRQVNADASSVIARLSAGDVGELTLVIEDDIVSSLEEMVAALVKVQKENKEKKQQQQRQSQGGGGGSQGDQKLVDKLSELRLVQTLQLRINKRTQAMSKMLENPDDVKGQADRADILQQVRELAERELKIHRVTLKVAEGQ